eukprot:5848460-Lingulodinium_polyedra.AAC.1
MESDVELVGFKCNCCQCKVGSKRVEVSASTSIVVASCSSVFVPNLGKGKQRHDTMKSADRIKGNCEA